MRNPRRIVCAPTFHVKLEASDLEKFTGSGDVFTSVVGSDAACFQVVKNGAWLAMYYCVRRKEAEDPFGD